MVSTNAAAARAELHRLVKIQALTCAHAARLAEEAARSCLASTDELDDAALLLCELATLPDAALARHGVDGIFRQAIEGMADAFEPRLCDRYIEFFARVVECCRRLPAAAWLDQRLRESGLHNEQDLIRRALGLRRIRPSNRGVKKILVLSRVTLGADVAITSVVLRKVMLAFPEAPVILLGSQKAAQLFAGERRVETRRVEYPRGGGLLDRLAAWPAVVDAARQELQGLRAGEYLVVDPDSRLTQLGMLPVVADESAYLFFESRSFARPGLESLAELTAAWLAETLGPDTTPLRPWVSLPPEAAEFAQRLRAQAGAQCVAVNLGVGDNPGKRIADPFEERLLAELLRRGWRIFLDQGEGDEEMSRAGRLLARLREAGRRVAKIEEGGALPTADAEVVAWRGSLAGFGALIGASDLYIGYDSA
ncbi:MAG TPA: hypothetical protein VEU62_19470, partial [Bryobacterales bacterium]|nr:hypothetical protein [Bryobacterales bacterium]